MIDDEDNFMLQSLSTNSSSYERHQEPRLVNLDYEKSNGGCALFIVEIICNILFLLPVLVVDDESRFQFVLNS